MWSGRMLALHGAFTSLLGVWVDPDLGLGQALHPFLVPPPHLQEGTVAPSQRLQV